MPAPISAALPCSYHRRVISQSDGHSVVKRCRETISLHLFGLGKEKLSGVLETKDKTSSHSFGQRGSKCTPKICALREKLQKNLFFLLFPPGEMKWTPFFQKNFFTPSLVLNGRAFLGGVFKKYFKKIILSLIPTEKDETATLFQKN